jgi:hypothetical protein
METIEECTYEELKMIIMIRMTEDLFNGELKNSISSIVDWSIRWWKAEEERRNIRAKYYIPDGALIADSDLSIRAIKVLTAENFITAKEIRSYLNKFDHPFQARTAVRKFPNCGRLTTTEIIDYYMCKV